VDAIAVIITVCNDYSKDFTTQSLLLRTINSFTAKGDNSQPLGWRREATIVKLCQST